MNSELKLFHSSVTTALDSVRDKSSVVVLGLEKSGKNTFVNQLLGVPYRARRCPATREVFLDVEEGSSLIARKSTGNNHYRVPDVFNASLSSFDSVYCVCPNMVSSNADHDDYSRMSVPLVLQASSGVRAVVVVIDKSTIELDRADNLAKLLASVGCLFNSEDALFQQSSMPEIFFVFTHVSDIGFERDHLLARIDELFTSLSREVNLDARVSKRQELVRDLEFSENDQREKALNDLDKHDEETEMLRGKLKILALIKSVPEHVFISDNQGNLDRTAILAALEATSNFTSGNILRQINYTETVLAGLVDRSNALSLSWSDLLRPYNNKTLIKKSLIEQRDSASKILESLRADNGLHAGAEVEQERIGLLEERLLRTQARIIRDTEKRDELDTNVLVAYQTYNCEIASAENFHYLKAVLQGGTAVAASIFAPAYKTLIASASGVAVGFLCDFLRERHRFVYEGIPFSRVEKECADGTAFKQDELSAPSQGQYSISYAPDVNGWAQVVVYVEKRLSHQQEITVLTDRLVSLEQQRDNIQEQIGSVRANLLKNKESKIEAYREEIKDASSALKNLQSLLADQEALLCAFAQENHDQVQMAVEFNSRYAQLSPGISEFLKSQVAFESSLQSHLGVDQEQSSGINFTS